MQLTLEQNSIAASLINRTHGSFGLRIGFFGRLFGCWHKELGRPVTSRGSSYRACAECGARRAFNPESFETTGPFYYPPSVKPEKF